MNSDAEYAEYAGRLDTFRQRLALTGLSFPESFLPTLMAQVDDLDRAAKMLHTETSYALEPANVFRPADFFKKTA